MIAKVSGLTRREKLVILEIGGDRIDSASSFVSYISESYGFSPSSVWYNLNRLKDKGVLDFASKETPGKLLSLTRAGLRELKDLERAGVRLDDMVVEHPPLPNLQGDATARIIDPLVVRGTFG